MIQEKIKKRRSIRKFSDRAIEFEKLTKVLEAGIYAPSSGNVKDYRFTVVTDKKIISEIANSAIEQYWINTASVVIVVSAEVDKNEAYYRERGKNLYSIQNSAAAIQNMLLAAEEEGLSTCWVGAFEDEKITTLLKMSENAVPQAIIPIGYKDEEPSKRDEPMLEHFVYFNEYGNLIKDIHLITREYNKEIQDKTEKTKGVTEKLFEEIKDLINKFKKKQ